MARSTHPLYTTLEVHVTFEDVSAIYEVEVPRDYDQIRKAEKIVRDRIGTRRYSSLEVRRPEES